MASLADTLTSPASARLIGSARRAWVLVALPLALCGCAAMNGCDDKASAQNAKVKISGQTYYLETALDDAKRFRGLSERTHIEDNGGMLFVFPEPRDPRYGGFVMRDCPIDIDIIYLDKSGRVVSSYEMVHELPRDPAKGEGTPADATNRVYNERLKQYVSRFPYTFVIELKDGSLKKLHVKEGDQVDLDRETLLKQAR